MPSASAGRVAEPAGVKVREARLRPAGSTRARGPAQGRWRRSRPVRCAVRSRPSRVQIRFGARPGATAPEAVPARSVRPRRRLRPRGRALRGYGGAPVREFGHRCDIRGSRALAPAKRHSRRVRIGLRTSSPKPLPPQTGLEVALDRAQGARREIFPGVQWDGRFAPAASHSHVRAAVPNADATELRQTSHELFAGYRVCLAR